MKIEERLKALKQLNDQIDREIKSMKIEKKIKTLKLGGGLTIIVINVKTIAIVLVIVGFLFYVDVKFFVCLAFGKTVVVKKNIIK